MIEILIETEVKTTIEKAWKCWTDKEHIVKWNNASEDWHTPFAGNDLRPGGKFLYRMEAKDKSFGFDFEGVYVEVRSLEKIAYTISDGRKVTINFIKNGDKVKIKESFEAEAANSVELQKQGWQAILDNYKKYTENININN